MRNAMLAMSALLAGGIAAIAGSAPATAGPYDYPWCVYGEELGYTGDCSYRTREQCLASSSGRWTTYCDRNRRLLFEPQQTGQPQRRGQRRSY